MHEIVILGAGYAGLATAASLAGRLKNRDDVRVSLVNAGERFTERLRLHQTATGQTLADLRIPDLIAGNKLSGTKLSGTKLSRTKLSRNTVELITGWVTGIDRAARSVRIDDEREIRYHTLVFALGGTADTGAIPGAVDRSYDLNGRTEAEALARRLAQAGSKAVAVCGAGLTGIEAAAEIAERHPDASVTLIGGPGPGADLSRRARRHVELVLDRLGVRVRSGVRIVKVLPDAVELAGGESVRADVVLWTAGVRGNGLAAAVGLAVDERGRIVTDGTLRSVSDPAVYAVGDAASIRQGYGVLHGTCQSGMPTGVHAARSIVRELDGQAPVRFRFGYLHTPVSLGRRDAVVGFTRPDGSPHAFTLTGQAAVWYKETVSAAPWPSFQRLIRMPAAGLFAWRRGGRHTR